MTPTMATRPRNRPRLISIWILAGLERDKLSCMCLLRFNKNFITGTSENKKVYQNLVILGEATAAASGTLQNTMHRALEGCQHMILAGRACGSISHNKKLTKLRNTVANSCSQCSRSRNVTQQCMMVYMADQLASSARQNLKRDTEAGVLVAVAASPRGGCA